MNRKKDRWVYGILFAILALSTLRDARLLFSFPEAVGDDGYYYVLQVHELLTHGHFYFSTKTPLAFWIISGLTVFTRNVVPAVKLFSLACDVLLCLGIFAAVSSITRNQWLGILGGVIVVFSGIHLYMIAEFVKNLAGIALLVWGAWFAIRASGKLTNRRIVMAILLIILSLLSHVSSWGLVPAFFTFILLTNYLTDTKRSMSLRLVMACVICLLAISPALLAYQNVLSLPPWVKSELLIRPAWPISLKSPVGTSEMFVLLMAAPGTLLLLVRSHRTFLPDSIRLAAGSVSLWSLLITLNPFLNHDVTRLGIVGRLDHLMYLQIAILIPALFCLVQHGRRRIVWVLIALTICFMVVSAAAPLPKGLQPWYLAQRQQMIETLPQQRQQLGPNPTVIARHGDEFVVTWVLGIPAQQNSPIGAEDQSRYWLLHQVNPTTLMASTIVVMEEENGSGLVLMRHDDMDQWMNKIGEEERNRLFTQNPHLKKYVDDEAKDHGTRVGSSPTSDCSETKTCQSRTFY